MFQPVRELLARLAADAKYLNPDVEKSYAVDQWVTVWTEGGEWPSYREIYDTYIAPESYRNLSDVQYYVASSMKLANKTLMDKFDSGEREVALSLDCGTGKSTQLVHSLHNMKYGVRTLVIEPSFSVARQLAKHMNCDFARNSVEVTKSRSVVYMNAGCMVDMILSGAMCKDDVVVIDEAHSVTLTYDLLYDLFSRTTHRIVLLTASTTPNVKAPRGVKMIETDTITPAVSDAIARETAHVVVGVSSNMTYATPANALIGTTLPLRLVYDTGLRPEPRVVKDVLEFGERQATIGELVQMIGRLARLGSGGIAYYSSAARSLAPTKGVPLYDILLRAIQSTIGLNSKLDRDRAKHIWKSSGLLIPMTSVDVGSISPIAVHGTHADKSQLLSPPPPSYKASVDDDCVTVRSRSSSCGSDYDKRPKHDYFVQERSPKADKGRRKSETSDKYQVTIGKHPVADLEFVYDDDDGKRRGKSRYRIRKHSSGSDDGQGRVVELQSSVRCPDGTLVERQPDELWRPFRRYNSKADAQIATAKDVSSFLDRVGRTVQQGDMLYPCVMPKLDPRQTTAQSREEARYVLSGNVLPSYSEIESLSVMYQWNSTVDSLGGRHMPEKLTSQFVQYFSQYCNHQGVRADYGEYSGNYY